MRAVASPDVERMSDIEVSEYAIRMSTVLESIQYQQLCQLHDIQCLRAEFLRYGLHYEDKEQVQKRLALLISSMY